MPAEKTLRPGKPEAGSTVHHVRAERFELVPYISRFYAAVQKTPRLGMLASQCCVSVIKFSFKEEKHSSSQFQWLMQGSWMCCSFAPAEADHHDEEHGVGVGGRSTPFTMARKHQEVG